MRDKNANTGEIFLSKLSPQALIEATNTVISISSTLSVGNAIEEVTVVSSFLPHPFHLRRTGLEVPKVLFTKPWLFEHFDLVSWEGGRCGIVGSQRSKYALGGLACTPIRRSEELDGVIGLEQGPELSASFLCLADAMRGKFDPVVWDELVDIAILVTLGLRMANQNDQLLRRELVAELKGEGERKTHPRFTHGKCELWRGTAGGSGRGGMGDTIYISAVGEQDGVADEWSEAAEVYVQWRRRRAILKQNHSVKKSKRGSDRRYGTKSMSMSGGGETLGGRRRREQRFKALLPLRRSILHNAVLQYGVQYQHDIRIEAARAVYQDFLSTHDNSFTNRIRPRRLRPTQHHHYDYGRRQ